MFNLKYEISKGNRKCVRCNKKISKDTQIMVIQNLQDVFVKGGNKRTVYKKKSYCRDCGLMMFLCLFDSTLEALRKEMGNFMLKMLC